MSFTRNHMPRPSARRHSLRFLILYIHNLIQQERQVLRSPFMCVSLRKQQTAYTAAIVSALWVNSFERGVPLTFKFFHLWKNVQLSKTLQTLLSLKVVSSIPVGVVQWLSATSYTFFTVSHQNGFSSSIQSASNLDLVCITYLYRYSVLKRLSCNFSGFRRAE